MWNIQEEGTGQPPKTGEKVQMSYAVRLENGSMIDVCPDDAYVISKDKSTPGSGGQLSRAVLDEILLRLRPGQVATVTSSPDKLLEGDVPPEVKLKAATMVAEVKLMHVYTVQDCSFETASKKVLKE